MPFKGKQPICICGHSKTKHRIGYYNWHLACGCGDLKQPISSLVKEILKFNKKGVRDV